MKKLAFILILWPIISLSQSEPLTYKFYVKDIATPQAAKAVVYHLMQYADATSCRFVDEEDFFKYTIEGEWTYEGMKSRLSDGGYLLTGKVFVSDGTVLKGGAEVLLETE